MMAVSRRSVADVSLLDRVDALGREAAERAREIEAARRLPDDLASGLIATGIARAWAPTAYGGLDETLQDGLDAIERLAYHDGSTGWCGMIAATTSLTAAFLPAEHATTIFGHEGACTGGFAMPAGKARRVDGGLVVDGRWAWGSGTSHCTFIGGGCLIEGESQAPFVFFERSQVERHEGTWEVAGLKGTGSTDYSVSQAFVPEGRWVNVLAGGSERTVESKVSGLPFMGVLALGVSTVALGLARRAQDELVALAGGKTPQGSAKPLAERQVTQAEVAKAEATWRSARALVRETVAEARTVDDETRRRLRLAATNATWSSVRAVDALYSLGGGSAIHESHPLQRVLRDVHVVTQHAMVAERTYEPLGRMALGLPTDTRSL
jgi:alkylation response protein AidB-like acyl-CoA dehydrogenase